MLGDISPQTVRITQQAVVYPSRDHVTSLRVERFDGRTYKPVDMTAVTRVILSFPEADPVIVYDSSVQAVFTHVGTTLTVDLSDYAMPASVLGCQIILYDAEHPAGQVLVDDIDAVVQFDFRNVSPVGGTPAPAVDYLTDAPIDGVTYARKDGVWVPVDMGGLFWSIVKIVLVPVLLGLLLHHFQRGLVDRLMPFLPLASALVITLVIAGIIAVNAQNILSAGPAIFAAVIAHNLLGLAVGWFAACRLRFAPPRRRALAIEIGTQNSGLATALALAHFTPAAAIAGALFSVWQNISGALLSNFWATRPVTSDSGEKDS